MQEFINKKQKTNYKAKFRCYTLVYGWYDPFIEKSDATSKKFVVNTKNVKYLLSIV